MSDVQSLPNPVDAIMAFLRDEWPEVMDIPGVWLSGGQVWRRIYAKPVEEAKDIDFFCTSKRAHKLMSNLLSKLVEDNDDFPLAPSMGPLGGEVWFTKRGRVDLWSTQCPIAAMRAYSDARQFARMAFYPHRELLFWLPSEVKRKKGERYIHCIPQTRKRCGGVVEILGPTLEWRESE